MLAPVCHEGTEFASDGPGVILAHAARDGSEILATHMRDKGAILEFVAARERDVGGEG